MREVFLTAPLVEHDFKRLVFVSDFRSGRNLCRPKFLGLFTVALDRTELIISLKSFVETVFTLLRLGEDSSLRLPSGSPTADAEHSLLDVLDKGGISLPCVVLVVHVREVRSGALGRIHCRFRGRHRSFGRRESLDGSENFELRGVYLLVL